MEANKPKVQFVDNNKSMNKKPGMAKYLVLSAIVIIVLIFIVIIVAKPSPTMTKVDDALFKKDTTSAISMLQEMGDNGDTAAYNRLAMMYYKGLYLKSDLDNALHYYHLSALLGNPYAQFMYGLYTQDGKEGITFLEKAAKQGYVDAMYELGLAFTGQESISRQWNPMKFKNSKEAEKYFLMAADKGHVRSYFELGMLYAGLRDHAFKRDDNKAFTYFEKGADNENESCYYYLGRCYRQGIGTKKDINKAIEVFRQGLGLGQANCIMQLYEIYYEGDGVRKNMSEAESYLGSAADCGDPKAQLYFAKKCYNDCNLQAAKEWCEKLRDNYDADNNAKGEAELLLGIMYGTGDFDTTKPDLEKAKYYFKQAVAHGIKRAQKGIPLAEKYKKVWDQMDEMGYN